MWLDILGEEKKKAFLDTIHKSLGIKAGLKRNEYTFHIDPTMENDIEWIAGPCIQIFIRYPPTTPLFSPTIKEAFTAIDLRDLLRSKALIGRKDIDIYHRIGIRGLYHEEEKEKSKRLRRTNFSYVTKLVAQDTKTKKKVEVELFNSNAFTAQEKALRLLYGD